MGLSSHKGMSPRIGIGRANLSVSGGIVEPGPNFIFTVKTDNTGATNNNQFRLPLRDTLSYDFTIDWGDGNSQAVTSNSNLTHTYASAGTYTITISKNTQDIPVFPAIAFGYDLPGDDDKLLSVDNWGATQWKSFRYAFDNCSNFDIKASDVPDLSTLTDTDFRAAFRRCSNLTGGVRYWDFSSITRISNMLSFCPSYNEDLSNCDFGEVTQADQFLDNCDSFAGKLPAMPKCTNFNTLLRNTPFSQPLGEVVTGSPENIGFMLNNVDNFDHPLDDIDISAVTNATQFMTLADGLSTANYDTTLVDWNNQAVANNVTGLSIDFGGSTYTAGSAAEAARNNLTAATPGGQGWTIVDGGSV